MKRCGHCKEEKPLSEYPRNRGNKDGLARLCKICAKISLKKYRQSNHGRKSLREYNKKYRRGNLSFVGNRKINDRKYHYAEKIGISDVEAILSRVGGKCEDCGSHLDLNIHHKDNKGWNLISIGLNANNDVDNLMVLCRSCHTKLHWRNRRASKIA